MVLDHARVRCPSRRDALRRPRRQPFAPVQERGSVVRILEGLQKGNFPKHLGKEVRVDLCLTWNPSSHAIIATTGASSAPSWCDFIFLQLHPRVRPGWHRRYIAAVTLDTLQFRCHQLTNFF